MYAPGGPSGATPLARRSHPSHTTWVTHPAGATPLAHWLTAGATPLAHFLTGVPPEPPPSYAADNLTPSEPPLSDIEERPALRSDPCRTSSSESIDEVCA